VYRATRTRSQAIDGG